jgi:hypothetical protein
MADGSFRRSLNAPYEHRRPLERLMASLSKHEARGAPLSRPLILTKVRIQG